MERKYPPPKSFVSLFTRTIVGALKITLIFYPWELKSTLKLEETPRFIGAFLDKHIAMRSNYCMIW